MAAAAGALSKAKAAFGTDRQSNAKICNKQIMRKRRRCSVQIARKSLILSALGFFLSQLRMDSVLGLVLGLALDLGLNLGLGLDLDVDSKAVSDLIGI